MSMFSKDIEVSAPTGSTARQDRAFARMTLGWSSFGLAVLQNICAAFIAVSGIRVALGIASVTAAGSVMPVVLRFHSDAIRLPMMSFALVGAILNLLVLWQIRRLRNRPSAQWRQVPLSIQQKRSERLQFILSVITLILLTVEYGLHRHLHG